MKKLIRILLVFVIAFGAILSIQSEVKADTLYEYAHETSGGTNFSLMSYSNNFVAVGAQQFMPTTSHILTKILVKVDHFGGNTTGNYLQINVRHVGGDGKPTGSSLSSGQVDVNTLPDIAGGYMEVPVSSYRVEAYTRYVITGQTTKHYHEIENGESVTMLCTGSNSYVNNTAFSSTDGGSTWTDKSNDWMFEEYGTEYEEPTLITENTTSITWSSAKLNGNLTDLGSFSEALVGMRIRENGTTVYSNYYPDNPEMTEIGTYNVTVSSLAADTTYDVGAFAYYNNATQTAYGDVEQFDTLPYNATPTPPPTNIIPTVTTGGVTRVDTSTITLHGTLSSLGTAGSVTVGFNFGTGIPPEYYFDAYYSPMTETGEFTVTLSGLSENQTYIYQAKAVGDGTAYGDYEIYDSLGIPILITYANSLGTTYSSTVLHGQLQSMGNYPFVDVNFEYGTTTAYGSVAQPSNHYTTSCTYPPGVFYEKTITGLLPLTEYHFRAVGTYGSGQVVYGEDISVTTMASSETDFPAVYTYPASNLTTTGATFNGALTRLGNLTWLESLGYPANVTVGFEVKKAESTSWNSANTYGTQSMNATGNYSITPTVWLEPNTHYQYRAVVAMWPSFPYGTGDNLIFRGNIQPFYTNPEVTQTPYQVALNAASNITKDSAQVSTSISGLASNTTSVAVRFSYGLGDPNNPTIVLNSPYLERTGNGLISYAMTGLTPGTQYWYSVYAMSEGSSVVGTPNYLYLTTLNANGSTPGVTPTPTATPPGGTGSTDVWDWFVTAIGHYFLLLIAMVATFIGGVFVGGRKFGAPIGGLVALIEFGAAWQAKWIDPTVMAFGAFLIGFVIWKLFFSAKGA